MKELYDEFGVEMKPTLKEIRIDDHLVLTETEKQAESAVSVTSKTISFLIIVKIIGIFALNKSLVQLWGMLDGIQFFFYLKYINYPMPEIIYNSLEHYSIISTS